MAFKASVLTALDDVENALVSLAKERERTAQLSTAASSYREAARLSRELYRAGSSNFLDVLDVLDAERSLYDAEARHAAVIVADRVVITGHSGAVHQATDRIELRRTERSAVQVIVRRTDDPSPARHRYLGNIFKFRPISHPHR